MPASTAVRIADAALEVLGTGGIHALSHGRVDTTAGLPPGSASNYFRTRAALVSAAVDRLRQLDAASFDAMLAAGPPASLRELAGAFTAFVEDATGRSRVRTVARYVIFIQGVVEPALLTALNTDRRRVVEWTGAALRSLDQPADVAPLVLAAVEGLIMHRLTGFATEPAGPRIGALFAGLCGAAELL